MRMKSLCLVGLVAVMVVAMTGCAKPPQELQTSVQSAMDEAKAAGAETYAPESLNKAQETMGQAQAEIETQNGKFALFRSYKKAEELLNQARTEAETAKSDAAAGKERARQEADAAINQAKTDLQTAMDALSKAPRGKGTKAEIEAMQQELTSLQQTLSEAEQGMQSEDFLGAKDKAAQVTQKAGEIANDIANAAQKKR